MMNVLGCVVAAKRHWPVLAALGTVGCASDLNSTVQLNSVSGYQTATAFSPIGHSMSAIDENRYRVTVVGSDSTPNERLEKIAHARAAEWGVEQKKKFFQAAPANFTVRCGKGSYVRKGETVTAKKVDHRVAEVEVVYAANASDPSYRPSKDTSAALQGQLQTDVVPPDMQASLAQEVKAQCGG
ncbi:MAG: hypothetical protein CTY31_03835 [Hyphomicrobium sp.]|nr:MAG: hypothetical protein CTY39_00750 [Hyphomicrobium sp.]PPD01867.1 MAG: hypothetical protein CTY31_03835 [Hyphomicrobium sp.]